MDKLKDWQRITYNLMVINELDNMNTTIHTQTDAISAIRAKQFIIGSISANGGISFSLTPAVHNTATEARKECKRLAQLSSGKMYFFVQLSGAEMVPVTSVSI